MKKRAFSLIEVLIVIAIILVVVAILFPVFGAAKREAWKTVDTSNMRQVGIAIEAYMSDNDGLIPPHNPFLGRVYQPGTSNVLYGPYEPLKAYGAVDEILYSPKAPEIDYDFRFELDLSKLRDPYPLDQTKMSVRPQPSSVLAVCWQYLDHGYNASGGNVSLSLTPSSELKGGFLALRADGSISRVPAGAVSVWEWSRKAGQGVWRELPPDEVNSGITFVAFPGEPFPPELFCQPGGCLGLP